MIDLFYLSKFLSVLIYPFTWSALLLLLALFWLPRRPVAAICTLLAVTSLTILVGWMPLPNVVLRSLETQYAVPIENLTPYVGLVILGGDIDVPRGTDDRRGFVMHGNGQRMTTSVALSRQYPDLRLLFSGGQSDIIDRRVSVADAARVYYASMGVPPEHLLYERKARTTYENAILSALVPGVDKTQRWLLVTSAWHMPRSMALFRAAGWNVTAYPVDFVTTSHVLWTDYSVGRGIVQWRLVLHELVGLVAFQMLGLANF